MARRKKNWHYAQTHRTTSKKKIAKKTPEKNALALNYNGNIVPADSPPFPLPPQDNKSHGCRSDKHRNSDKKQILVYVRPRNKIKINFTQIVHDKLAEYLLQIFLLGEFSLVSSRLSTIKLYWPNVVYFCECKSNPDESGNNVSDKKLEKNEMKQNVETPTNGQIQI